MALRTWTCLLIMFVAGSFAQDATDVQIDEVIARTPDVAQQHRILELLPQYVDLPVQWNKLLDHLNLDLLGPSDCGVMTRAALLLERAYLKFPQSVRPPVKGGRVDPHALLTRRIKTLILPDVSAFDEAVSGQPPGLIGDFWKHLLSWTDQHEIKSKAVEDVRSEVAAHVTGTGAAPAKLPDTWSPVRATAEDESPSHWLLWTAGVIVVAALLVVVLKRR